MVRLLLILLLLAPAAHAQTYKWVDERGVVNYSNTPPPNAAKSVQTVADRVSTYEVDPVMKQAIAYGPSPYEQMAQQEWLQRQRLMAQTQQIQAMQAGYQYDDYRYGYGSGYYPAYYPTFATRAVRPVQTLRPGGGLRVVHHSSRGGSVRRF